MVDYPTSSERRLEDHTKFRIEGSSQLALRMTSYLGVDWANGCWLVVKTGDDTLITTEPSILNVWHEHGDDVQSMLVDIPIGLPDSGPRSCDEEAKSELADRGSTVFPIPGRTVVEAEDYCTARKENGGKLGSQSWWLFPRILEVDVFLQEHGDALEKIYESHPEICFAKLAGDSLSWKSSEEGPKERLEVLESDPELHDQVKDLVDEKEEGAAWHDRISKGRIDDVLDAAVLAFTANQLDLSPRSEPGSYPAFPEDSTQQDSKLGIQPEIRYPMST